MTGSEGDRGESEAVSEADLRHRDEKHDGAGSPGNSDSETDVEVIDEQNDPRVKSGWLDGWELAQLGLFALLSMAVLGPLLFKGRQLSGSDGLFPPDQLQYLTWVRQASVHWLIGNEFDFRQDNRVFLHPGFLLSGLIHRWTGASLQVSYLAVWKPIAVVVGFFGCRQYIRRLVPAGWPARTALFIALFVVMPWSAMFKALGSSPQTMYTYDFISGELWTGQTLLGYMMTTVAVYTMPLVLLGVERVRGRELTWGGRATLALCAIGAMLVMWLQPWQGAELLIVIVGVELWQRRAKRASVDKRLLWVLIAGAAPAVYYAWIGATDPSWHLASVANRGGAQPLWNWPISAVFLSLAPLAIPAVWAFFGPVTGWQSVAVRIWPFAVLLVYAQPFGTFPYHSVQGLMIPLAVLSVQGFTTRRPTWMPRPRALWIVPALVVLVIPGTLHKLSLVRDNIHGVAYPYYVFDGEDKALSFLEQSPIKGGVLTDSYGGLLVPPLAGREVYIGPFSWTPSWELRARLTGSFFAGKFGDRASKRFVASTGARFVFQQCMGRVQAPMPLDKKLGSLVDSVREFGCARVYVLKPYPRAVRVGERIGAAE